MTSVSLKLLYLYALLLNYSKIMKLKHAAIYVLALLFVACTVDKDQLVIKGTVVGAKKETLYLKKMVNQKVILIDSLVLSPKGTFKFKSEIPAYPEFYFLNLKEGGSITLLSDSGQQIVVETTFDNFVDEARITDNKYSQRIQDFNKEMAQLRADFINYRSQYESADAEKRKELVDGMTVRLNAFKNGWAKEIVTESKSFYAYYLLYQRITDDYLLYDPYSQEDSKYYKAVANVLSVYFPDAPRTKALLSSVKQVMAEKQTQILRQMIEDAPEGIPEIVKPDVNGKDRRLTDLKGKLVVLNYWASADAKSRQWNKVLKSIYSKYRSQGLEIYQYSADKSKLIWEDAMTKDGITWISVCDFEGEGSDALWKYNVKKLPSTYLISKKGTLLGAYDDEIKLREAIKNNI